MFSRNHGESKAGRRIVCGCLSPKVPVTIVCDVALLFLSPGTQVDLELVLLLPSWAPECSLFFRVGLLQLGTPGSSKHGCHLVISVGFIRA